MPQFDLFTFTSQIFWALFLFTLLYLSFTYYLLPSMAATLKVRKRRLKLQESSSTSEVSNLSSDLLDLALERCFIKPSFVVSVDNSFKTSLKSVNSMSFNSTLWNFTAHYITFNDFKTKRLYNFFEFCLFKV